MKHLAVLFAFLLASCATHPHNGEQWMSRERNSCLPLAISMVEGLKRQKIQAQVIRYSYNNSRGKRVGHAIAAYLYPPGQNQLWTYDHEGSWRTRAYWNDPKGIARAAESLRARYYPIEFAEILTDY